MKVSNRIVVDFFLTLTVIISFLFLRKVLIFAYPIILFSLFYFLNLKLTKKQVIFLGISFIVGIFSSALDGFYLSNVLFSWFLIFPLYILLTSKVKQSEIFKNSNFLDDYIKKITFILIVVNISAFIYSQFIIDTSIYNFEDSFTGFYGTSGFGSHSLSLINFCMSMIYFYKKEYLKFIFFIVCGILGFYGLGLMIFIVTIGLLFIPKMLKYWKKIIPIFLIVIVGTIFINQYNPKNLNYIKKNLSESMLVFDNYSYEAEMIKASDMKVTTIPRFITFLEGSRRRLFGDIKVFFIGTSPGGYNSRVAFYLNGDFVENRFLKNNFKNRTEYHKKDIFPLLNRTLIERPFNDGTRNQTFSSIVVLFLEYGIFIGGFFLFFFFSKIRKISRMFKNGKTGKYIKFLSIFIFLLFCVQNYLEYPEIIFPIVLLIKLAEVDYINNKYNREEYI